MLSNFLRISHLVRLYLAEDITDEEMDELLEWQKEYPVIGEWLENKEGKNSEIKEKYLEYIHLNVLSDWDRIKATKKIRRTRKVRQRWIMAASFVSFICLGTWLVQRPGVKAPEIAQTRVPAVEPGKKQARLILSNGSTVVLGQQENLIIEEGEIKMKLENKSLDYTGVSSKQVYWHRIEVPRGGTYFLKLPDGTSVWLNAESTMEFPTAFNGTERVVSIKGEAYFEVAKDALKPFLVKVDGTTVEAIGTAFNINTHWKTGQVKTILTEGKIKVSDGESMQYVNAGHATLSGNGLIRVEKADTEEALAWRDGYFYFDGKNLKEIMEEISRWYNVELDFKTETHNETYKGGIKRTESIESVCTMLEGLTSFDLEVKNRTLLVRSKTVKN
jgi:transmembrane sensor